MFIIKRVVYAESRASCMVYLYLMMSDLINIYCRDTVVVVLAMLSTYSYVHAHYIGLRHALRPI